MARGDNWSPAASLHAVALSEGQRWEEAARLTAGRMLDGDPYEQQLDVRSFVLTLRQILYAAEMVQGIAKRVAPDARKPLISARKKFEDAVPGLTDARDVLVHFPEYARGLGHRQSERISNGEDIETVARDFWSISYDPMRRSIEIGPYRINVERACAAAEARNNG